MSPVGFDPTISAGERPQTYALGHAYIGARNDTTQQSGQTPDKEVEIKNITVYVSGYTEIDTTGMLSLPTVWRQQSEFVFEPTVWPDTCCSARRFRVSL